MAEFSTWRAYQEFEREVSRSQRYIRTEDVERFLERVRSTCQSRKGNISRGRGFWRAQAGYTLRNVEEIDSEMPAAFDPDRMKPLPDRAMEGRANARGIPVLYLCTNKEAAMSEVRPWLGSMISLGHFETTRDLSIVDCTRDLDGKNWFFFREPPDEERDAAVWSQINRAFTTPVTRNDDRDEYVATQILAELFKSCGYDGIAYRSAFGESSMNVVLFDTDDAKLTSCQLFEMTSAKFNFQERDDPYWVRSAKTSSSASKKKSKKIDDFS